MRPISAEASRGYSHLTSGNSKEYFTPLLQLKKFPDMPVSTRKEERDFRPHPEEPRFRLLAREVGSFPCVVGKEFLAFPSHLKRRRSPQERREELQGRATIPSGPQMSHSIPGKPVFPACLDFEAEDPLTPRWHVGLPSGKRRGKASWQSLVAKPPRKATDSWIHAKGSVTLLLQLWRKLHVHASTRDED